jgi:hypothetical protein
VSLREAQRRSNLDLGAYRRTRLLRFARNDSRNELETGRLAVATRLQPVDAVTIGVGLTGSLAAHEMVQSGLKVVGFERGAERETVPDFQSPAIHDELRYSIRKAFMQDNAKVAVSFRNTSDQTALPIRRWESFLPGQGLGGSFVHWNGQSFRAQVADFGDASRFFAGTVEIDAQHLAAGPQLIIRVFEQDRQDDRLRAGLGIMLASVALAEPAKDALLLELERIRAVRCANHGFRLYGLRSSRRRSLPGLARQSGHCPLGCT